MNIHNNIAEIGSIITDIQDTLLTDLDGLRKSEHIDSSRIDLYIEYMELVVDGLEDMQGDLNDEVYDEVREAMETDRQYAAEIVIILRNQGEDIETIATNLETSMNAVIDLIDEFAEVK